MLNATRVAASAAADGAASSPCLLPACSLLPTCPFSPLQPATYDYKGTQRPWNLGPHFQRYNTRNVSLDALQATCERGCRLGLAGWLGAGRVRLAGYFR